MGVKNFERLLISKPKCIELNSELILVLGLGSGSGLDSHKEPIPYINFFLGEMSVCSFFSLILRYNFFKFYT